MERFTTEKGGAPYKLPCQRGGAQVKEEEGRPNHQQAGKGDGECGVKKVKENNQPAIF